MKRLWIDDIRPAPDGWVEAKTVTEAIRLIHKFGYQLEEISLDHDISFPVTVGDVERPFPSPDTFHAVAFYIATYKLFQDKVKKDLWHPKITIHTSNPDGAKAMKETLELVGFKPEVSLLPAASRND